MRRTTPTPESLVLKAVVAYLRLCRLGVVRRVNTGQLRVGGGDHPWGPKGRFVRFGEPGHSDLVLELAGEPRSVYIEVKAGAGKPTQAQLDFLERQRQRGHLGFVAWSVDDVARELRAAGFAVPIPGPSVRRRIA